MFLGQCSVACRRSKSCKVIASLQTDPASDWKETVSNDFNYISKAHDKAVPFPSGAIPRGHTGTITKQYSCRPL
eukprot:9500897-Pyramimonas_sp.AAC.1